MYKFVVIILNHCLASVVYCVLRRLIDCNYTFGITKNISVSECTGFLCLFSKTDSASLSAESSTTPTQPHPSTKHPSQPPTAQEPVNLEQLVKRLQEHVLSNRIRVSEHFEDFDPLRSGSISTSKFRQVHVLL